MSTMTVPARDRVRQRQALPTSTFRMLAQFEGRCTSFEVTTASMISKFSHS
jgi:hypothetical protein